MLLAERTAVLDDLLEERGIPKRLFAVWNTGPDRQPDFSRYYESMLIWSWHDSMERLRTRIRVVLARIAPGLSLSSYGSCNYYSTDQYQGEFIAPWAGAHLHWPVHVKKLPSGAFMSVTTLRVTNGNSLLRCAWWTDGRLAS